MKIRKRKKPYEMEVLESLEGRLPLSPKFQRQLRQMRDGYLGEERLDLVLEGLADSAIIVDDFVMSQNQTCQIDTVLVTANSIILLDAKNWNGQHTVSERGFEQLSNDPLDQLKRAEKIFSRMLEFERIQLPVYSRLVFVNPKMTLYGIQPEMPIVLSQQIPEFVSKIRQHSGEITKWELQLALRILSHHTDENPYHLKVDYSWDEIGKGMLCRACRVKMVEKNHKYVRCLSCGVTEAKGDALRRTKIEMDVLFPGCKPEVDRLYRFCGEIVDKRTIHRMRCDIETEKMDSMSQFRPIVRH